MTDALEEIFLIVAAKIVFVSEMNVLFFHLFFWFWVLLANKTDEKPMLVPFTRTVPWRKFVRLVSICDLCCKSK